MYMEFVICRSAATRSVATQTSRRHVWHVVRGCANLHPLWFASPRVAVRPTADCHMAVATQFELRRAVTEGYMATALRGNCWNLTD